ncbi:helix-turn-helix transcriptional regulator [Neisseriaceae bacterium B1]
MADKFLRINQFSEKCGISKSMIWAKLNPKNRRHDSDFPQPIRLSSRAVAWLESELDTWINHRAENHRAKQTS